MSEEEKNDVPMSEWVVYPQSDHPEIPRRDEIRFHWHEDGKTLLNPDNQPVAFLNDEGTLSPINEEPKPEIS